MNTLYGQITAIETSGTLSLVAVAIGTLTLKSLVVNTPHSANYLKVGHAVQVNFKAMEVIVGKGNDFPISLQNKIPGQIIDLATGTLLCKLSIATAAGNLSAIIPADAVRVLALQEGEAVTAMIKMNEVMLSDGAKNSIKSSKI